MYKVEQNELNLEKQFLSTNNIKPHKSISNCESSKDNRNIEIQRLVSLAKIRTSYNSVINKSNNLDSNETNNYLEEINDELLNSSSTSFLASASYLISSNAVLGLLTHDCDTDDDDDIPK